MQTHNAMLCHDVTYCRHHVTCYTCTCIYCLCHAGPTSGVVRGVNLMQLLGISGEVIDGDLALQHNHNSVWQCTRHVAV